MNEPLNVIRLSLYAGIALAAIFHNVDSLLWVAIWVGVMLTFAGRRFFHVRLPAFFEEQHRGVRYT